MSGNRRKPYGVRITIGRKDNGQQIYKYLGYYESRTDAIIALAEYNRLPYDLDANRITFAEVYNRYMESLYDVSDSLVKLNHTCFRHCTALHSIAFKDIRKIHLQELINGLETPTAKSNVASFFRKLFRFAIENDLVIKDYSQFVTTPKKPSRNAKKPFSKDEIDLLWDNVGDINAEILLILAYSGMRISELLLLEKSMVNMDACYIITGSKSEAGIDRYIPIHNRIKPIIAKHMKNTTKWVIPNRFETAPIRYDSFHAKRFKKIKKKLAFDDAVTPHSTRHFFISELHRLGADKIAVQKIVGHKGQDVTEQSYTHIDKKILHDVVNLLE